MGELHMFFPDRSGVTFPRDGEVSEFVWTICDICNQPNDQARGDHKIPNQIWICEPCSAKGYR